MVTGGSYMWVLRKAVQDHVGHRYGLCQEGARSMSELAWQEAGQAKALAALVAVSRFEKECFPVQGNPVRRASMLCRKVRFAVGPIFYDIVHIVKCLDNDPVSFYIRVEIVADAMSCWLFLFRRLTFHVDSQLRPIGSKPPGTVDPFHPRAGQIPHGVGAKIEMGRTNRRGCGENLNGFMCSVSICEASKGSEMQCNALLKKTGS